MGMRAFWAAIQRPGGAVGRGPRRWYVEIHPQDFGGFVELTTHPWVVGMCRAALGDDYQIVEIGFDTPFQGAMNQPWHRDFPSPPDTYRDRRLTSLAFNLTGVDVTPDMGPMTFVSGSHREGYLAAVDISDESENYFDRLVRERSWAVTEPPLLEAGDATFHAGWTLHRAAPNTTGTPNMPSLPIRPTSRPKWRSIVVTSEM